MERKEGRGRPVAPNSQQQERGQEETKERQPLPSVWEVLESRVRLAAKFNSKDTETRITYEEHELERLKLSRLSNEISKKGTDRDKLIIGLFNSITIQPGKYGPSDRDLSLEEFQQLRSKVEPLAEEEIREEIRSVNEEYNRQWKVYNNLHKSKNPRLMPRLACWQPSLRDRFRAQDIDDSDN
jgi:hypothetical protein